MSVVNKRKRIQDQIESHKRVRRTYVTRSSKNWDEWISATKTANYLLNDPLIDWLETHGTKKGYAEERNYEVRNPVRNHETFTSYIMKQGIKFEKYIMEYLFKKRKKGEIVEIAESWQSRDESKFLATLAAMKSGVPFIYQAVVYNESNKTYGAPDLLVRSDYLHELVDKVHLTNEERIIPSPKLKQPFHYVVVDIKYTSLPLRADGEHLLNAHRMPAYKGQLLIYRDALTQMQGYESPYAFILGKAWTYSTRGQSFSGYNCMDRLGRINYVTIDKEWIAKTNLAVNWVRAVRQEGHEWSIDPPSRPELFPNMCRDDYKWQAVKEKLAEKNREITTFWQCGHKNRSNAMEKGIVRWDDPNCTAENLGVLGGYQNPVLNQILHINRSESETVLPPFIANNDGGWQQTPKFECFVDFETINNVFDDFSSLPATSTQKLIFMIGVGWSDPENNGKWTYIDFTVDDLSLESEKKMINQFYDFMIYLRDVYLGEGAPFPRMYHWGHAEKTAFDGAMDRHPRENWRDLNTWFDLLPLFRRTPIVVKGAKNFGLKEIAKAFHSLGLIETKWKENTRCSDGHTAMLSAWKCQQEAKRKKVSMKTLPAMVEVMEYNECDCRVLWEILMYLRKNHTLALPESSDEEGKDDTDDEWFARNYQQFGGDHYDSDDDPDYDPNLE